MVGLYMDSVEGRKEVVVVIEVECPMADTAPLFVPRLVQTAWFREEGKWDLRNFLLILLQLMLCRL